MEVRVLRGTVTYGSGDGYGYGDGAGYGYGDIVSCKPLSTRIVTAADLRGACSDQVKTFIREFPNGATWPDDWQRAKDAGLDMKWAAERLGLFEPR